jgi:putative FmdB family regulatory protein
MPTYEYECRACGHEFEREQRISEDPIKTCPRCKKDEARRLISRTSFVLKGGGWYSDLYSSKPAPKSGGDSPSDAKPAGEKSEKSEKPAKTEKAEKSGKAEKAEKTEKPSGKPDGSPKGSGKGPSKSAA